MSETLYEELCVGLDHLRHRRRGYNYRPHQHWSWTVIRYLRECFAQRGITEENFQGLFRVFFARRLPSYQL